MAIIVLRVRSQIVLLQQQHIVALKNHNSTAIPEYTYLQHMYSIPPRKLAVVRRLHDEIGRVKCESGRMNFEELDWFGVEHGLRQGCALALLMCNISFAVVMRVEVKWLSASTGVLRDVMSTTVSDRTGGRKRDPPYAPGAYAGPLQIWEILCADGGRCR